jgi:hypothetical protein
MILTQMQENESGIPKADSGKREFESSCGAIDRRECTLMKHILLAEIRRSNAPAWVVEEVERKLNCHSCRGPMIKMDLVSWL